MHEITDVSDKKICQAIVSLVADDFLTLMTLKTISLPYSPDALTGWFSRVSEQPWAMLLSSSGADHHDNRFDIFSAAPLRTLTTRGTETTIEDADGFRLSGRDPLALVQEALEILPAVGTPDADIPFAGGALGLFGYDLGRRFEHLPQRAINDLQTPDMAVGIYDWAMIADHHQKRLTLVSLSDVSQRLHWLSEQQLSPQPPFRLLTDWESNLSAQGYARCFERVKEYIRAGDCYQINLAQRFSAGYEGSEWQAWEHLSHQNRAPFSAFIRLNESCLLSLSPERFLKVSGSEIETRPIKGTRPRMTDPQEDARQAAELAVAEKDRAENLMIVDLLRNDIGRIATPGSVTVPELFTVEPFPAVHHLVSTVRGSLPADLHPTDLLRSCFPGGSITGAPKIRAMEIIDELEPHRRNAWCGSIGYLSRCGTMDTSITIRTLTAEGGKLYCTAGGGIVADSVLDEEYQETFHKVQRILPALQHLSASACNE
ncbi:Para-aminobenzoate synthase component 1 [Tatumella ptyseos]|uniref:Aminodeoxychorismate synthase component 1 n=2 Tax=Tatumella ptyseos TaxID=82987 RepID=A0A2X5PAD0_9GAMM|nr:Para-aminobenzoate synthase component 1 [Tatumella ptyseos]